MTVHERPALLEGRGAPMGAHARDGGVDFAVFSDHAEAVELCLFDDQGAERARLPMHGPRDGVWQGFLPGAAPGLVYGYRVHGPWAPGQGHRFNANKLLLDPWAREIVGRFEWRPEHHGYTLGHEDGLDAFDTRDNAATALKARVATPRTRREGEQAPRIADRDLVLYEVHVKGFSATHPDIPEALRGTYAALAHPASIAHFKRLGVTTLSLLPVQWHLDEPMLAGSGRSNYWGYNTLGFFCPDPRLARAGQDPAEVNDEFREMVRTLHAHGLEVVLDVVYNHTPEGNEAGATISFRGFDQAAWYWLDPTDKRRLLNWSACGNAVRVAHPRVTQFVLDSLRCWVDEYGVDGFRFDLAPVLGRNAERFDPEAPFFVALKQDPVLARAKLIAEPWDSGPHGYRLGQFPDRWMEWNDRFRDAARAYWLSPARPGAAPVRGEFARRFAGSGDVFDHAGRRPTASVNFIAVHDGFTLHDFTAYARKHNLANGEDNRDGRDDELAANFGIEGETDDAAIESVRERVRRALMATLLLAQGTPMLCAGDEIGRTQQGNNNAWNQDGPIAWLDWTKADGAMADFVAEALALRRAEPALRHDRWFRADSGPALRWLTPAGREAQYHAWHDPGSQALACLIDTPDTPPGAPPRRLLVAFNPEPVATAFVLPGGPWQPLFASAGAPTRRPDGAAVPAHSIVVFQDRPREGAGHVPAPTP